LLLPIVQFAKLLVPGSWSLLLVTASLSAALLYQQRPFGRAVARVLLAATVMFYWLISLPAVADAIQRGYPAVPVLSADAATGRTAVVVLSAGVQAYRIGDDEIDVPTAQSAFNVLDGALLFQRLGEPWVIVSGGIADASRQRAREADVLAALLRDHGVPESRILIERTSNTTYTQAVEVAALAKRRGLDRLIVVTSPAHLRRAVPAFRAQGIDAVGAAARYATDRRIPQPRWLPSLDALGVAQDAIYDYAGWLYYRSRGWLGAPSH
jgi:uncharacterized SAM-binding protein YcdF (DUF218 family)